MAVIIIIVIVIAWKGSEINMNQWLEYGVGVKLCYCAYWCLL